MSMVMVSIEVIKRMQKERERINGANLKDIEWLKDGEPIEIDHKLIEQFEFTGLSNIDFITSGFYETGFEKYNKEVK